MRNGHEETCGASNEGGRLSVVFAKLMSNPGEKSPSAVYGEWSPRAGVSSRLPRSVSFMRNSNALLSAEPDLSIFCPLTLFNRSSVFFRGPLGPDLILCLRRVHSIDDLTQAAHGAWPSHLTRRTEHASHTRLLSIVERSVAEFKIAPRQIHHHSSGMFGCMKMKVVRIGLLEWGRPC